VFGIVLQASKYPEMVPSAIQQSRGPQHATGMVYSNTHLPSNSTDTTAYHAHMRTTPSNAEHAWGGPPRGWVAHSAQQMPQWSPSPAEAPAYAAHPAHAGFVQPAFGPEPGVGPLHCCCMVASTSFTAHRHRFAQFQCALNLSQS
jgi:hypothetical protein